MEPIATTSDWLERAAAAPPATRAELLVHGEAVASSAGDWQRLADAWLEAGDPRACERCLGEVLRRDDLGVWDHRNAAATFVQLGKPLSARDTLAAFEAVLLATVEPDEAWRRLQADGLSWRLLAEGYAELGDDGGVHRSITSGTANAVDIRDLCQMAEAHTRLLGDSATANTLLARAEAMAAIAVDHNDLPDTHPYWTLAIAYHEVLQDDERRRASLDAGLRRATTSAGCLTMARAWSCWTEPPRSPVPEFHACIERARQFASSCDDWIEIAEAVHEAGGDSDAVREELRRAAAQAANDAERRAVAGAWQRWCGESGDAEFGPVGLAPAALAPPRMSPLGWQHDGGALLEWLRARVTEPMLASIAAADRGDDVAENLTVLEAIRRDGHVPVPLQWHPREVLQLSQWDEGLAVDHVERAFCCAVLLVEALAEDRHATGGLESTLAILIESCVHLGPEALAGAAGLLIAFVDGVGQHDVVERSFCVLGLLLVAIRLDADDARAEGLAGHLLTLVAVRPENDYPHPEHGFVLGATHSMGRMPVWHRLVRDTLPLARIDGRPALARVVARLLAAP